METIEICVILIKHVKKGIFNSIKIVIYELLW